MVPRKAKTQSKPRRRITTPSGGGIDYALGQIDTQLMMVQQVLSEDRLSSAQYRTHVREILTSLQNKQIHMEGQMDHVSTTLIEVKDSIKAIDARVETLEIKNSERTGFGRAMELVGRAGYVVAGGVGSIIALVADRYLKGSPPPHP